MRNILTPILLLSLFLSACIDDSLNSELPAFSKLYYGTQSVEAHDFLEITNASGEEGYLILASIYNSMQSDIYLIAIDNEGYVNDTIRVKTNSFDKGVTLKEHNGEIYVLGTRTTNNFLQSIIFKTNLSGTPIKAENDTTQSIATIFTLENSNSYSMKMNDFIINDDKVVLGGTLFEGNNTGEIVQIYDLAVFNNFAFIPVFEYELPVELEIDNTTILRVFKGHNNNVKYTTVGQNFIPNDPNTEEAASRNIVKKIFTQYNSPATWAPRLYSTKQENLGDAFQEPNTGTMFYAGSYGTAENNQKTFNLFIIRDDFNPLNGSDSLQIIENANNEINDKFGNTVVSVTQNAQGTIYIASTIQTDEVNIGPSKLFKLSASGDFLTEEPVELESSRFYNINKIKISRDNKILILSSIEFENNANAAALMKINF